MKINKKYILERFKHEDLFVLAGFPVEEGYITNPLRDDSNAGCFYERFNGVLYFADFTGFFGKSNIDGVDLLKIVTGIEDHGELYDWINYQMGNFDVQSPEIAPTAPKRPVVIEYESWGWRDNNYFTKYHIPKHALEIENVHWLSSYKANTRRSDVKIRNIIGDPSKSPIVGYQFDDRLKVYNPYGSVKWFGNVTVKDVWGYDTFDRDSGYCIITKSAKDFMVIKYVLGYECIALQNEGMALPDKVVDLIRGRKVYVVFDTDEPGLKASKKLCKNTDFRNLILPEFTDGFGGVLTTDTSDIVYLKGVREVVEIFDGFNIDKNYVKNNRGVSKRVGILGG